MSHGIASPTHTGDAIAGSDFARRYAALVEHLDHRLPSQAPIRDFVHHNTLHGFQHLPFAQALAAARRELGIAGYWPMERFRAEFAAGRIDAGDLDAALDAADPQIDAPLEGAPAFSRRAVWRVCLREDCLPRSAAAVKWALDEGDALQDEAAETRRWRGGAKDAGLAALWQATAALVQAPTADAAPSAADDWESQAGELAAGRITLRDLLLRLTGEDLLDTVRGELVRHGGAHLDLGLASWRHPGHHEGLYAAWRRLVVDDAGWAQLGDREARARLLALPAEPLAAMAGEFQRLGLAEDAWCPYLERLALQLPGWSGQFLWRQKHPGVGAATALADFLAIRLITETLAADVLARRYWGIAARLPSLAEYFGTEAAHRIELRLRLACHRGELQEALASRVQRMEAPGERAAQSRATWIELAREAQAVGGRAQAADEALGRRWQLFRLAGGLGLSATALEQLGGAGAAALLACADQLDEDRAGQIWLGAYERHYAEQVFAALAANHGRAVEPASPGAQLVLCMDDREEGFRRHLEELDPHIETLGGAAHFGVFQNWRGLGETSVTPLCPVVPVVVKPAHEVREVARDDAAAAAWLTRREAQQAARARRLNGTRLGLLGALAHGLWQAPAEALRLAAHAFAPARTRIEGEPPPATRLQLTAAHDAAAATPEAPRLGFTDAEQAERIGNYLTALGLTHRFAPLVVIVGHGSNSQNNPHLSAYDCGACAGRHSGPNARLFAAMANRPAVRALLAARGIVIPQDTWFLGAEHNTCDDEVVWYDAEDLPPPLAAALATLRATVTQAGAEHARERCRRLMSAPLDISPQDALRHVAARRHDFAQARPELGHATNACAFIGRRRLSRGAFFDRRSFLISYDPSQDADGAILARHLCTNGPVGAGISLEYYFSTVNNERFGCGTKIMHNLVGQFGVMAGTGSDLRTGLPRQMIEIHEPMRLLVVVEHRLEVITAIYQAQPAVRELVGNGWLQLAAVEPAESAADAALIHRFDPARGWLRWQAPAAPLPEVERSADWFAGQREALPPALLRRPLATDTAP